MQKGFDNSVYLQTLHNNTGHLWQYVAKWLDKRELKKIGASIIRYIFLQWQHKKKLYIPFLVFLNALLKPVRELKGQSFRWIAEMLVNGPPDPQKSNFRQTCFIG